MNNDMISRAAAINAVNAYDYRGISLRDVRTVTDGCADEIRRLPAIDAEPVRHGRWVQNKTVQSYHHCSCCRTAHNMPKSCNIYVLPYYCPNCGAKMDLEGEK